ncbi:hypothetical protein Tco_1220911 [Tanacetum coccineum]
MVVKVASTKMGVSSMVFGLRLSGLLITYILAPFSLRTLLDFRWAVDRILDFGKMFGSALSLYVHVRFNRLFRLERNKNCLVRDRISNGHWKWSWSRNDLGTRNSSYLNQLLTEISHIEVREGLDKCVWSLAQDGMFTVGLLRRTIDDHSLPSLGVKTHWDKLLPRKVNIFMWRLKLDRLLHRFNLSSRGIDIPVISCPL